MRQGRTRAWRLLEQPAKKRRGWRIQKAYRELRIWMDSESSWSQRYSEKRLDVDGIQNHLNLWKEDPVSSLLWNNHQVQLTPNACLRWSAVIGMRQCRPYFSISYEKRYVFGLVRVRSASGFLSSAPLPQTCCDRREACGWMRQAGSSGTLRGTNRRF